MKKKKKREKRNKVCFHSICVLTDDAIYDFTFVKISHFLYVSRLKKNLKKRVYLNSTIKNISSNDRENICITGTNKATIFNEKT